MTTSGAIVRNILHRSIGAKFCGVITKLLFQTKAVKIQKKLHEAVTVKF